MITIPITEVELDDKLILFGPPGIGKTEIIRQRAEEEAKQRGKILVDLRTATDEEINAIFANPDKYYVFYRMPAPNISKDEFGVPMARHSYGHYFMKLIPPPILAILELPNIEGVLFIDEIASVFDDNLFTMFYSIVQEKEASWFYKFSKNIKIILAGNPPNWSSLSRTLSEAMRSRLTLIHALPASIDEWYNYMMKKHGNNWDKFTYAYLKLYPNDFFKPPASDEENFPTPRNWEELAIRLPWLRKKSKVLLRAYAVGRLGVEVGSRFASLLETEVTEKDINDIIRFPPNFAQLDIDKKLLVVYSVASRINTQNYKQYMEFLKYLNNEREFLLLILQLIEKNVRLALIKEMRDIVVPLLKEIIQYEVEQ
jgi:hypothetical protein